MEAVTGTRLFKCSKCDSVLFNIKVIPCCDECSENGAWISMEEGYTHDEKTINEKELDRNQVDECGECRTGDAFGAGCHMYVCTGCGKEKNLPFSNGC